MKIRLMQIVIYCGILTCFLPTDSWPQQKQYHAPMVDYIRKHQRIEDKLYEGVTFNVNGVLPRPVEIYFDSTIEHTQNIKLLIHFHGASYVPKYAVLQSEERLVLAVVNLGSGSSVYERPFQESGAFTTLVSSLRDSMVSRCGTSFEFTGIYFSSFSAGYGAVRAILKEEKILPDGILLLDGLHTDYIPESTVLYEGGALNEVKMKGFLKFAELALKKKKRFIITHSEIFPGTYASTTETADFIIQSLGLKRESVLNWGPLGMQMIGETHAGGLSILAFAGNTARDHVDHYQGMFYFLELLMND